MPPYHDTVMRADGRIRPPKPNLGDARAEVETVALWLEGFTDRLAKLHASKLRRALEILREPV